MFVLAIVLALTLGQVMSQTACHDASPTNTFSPVVMRYTPYMTAQIGPTSTIWETIVTTWFNAIDCKFVTPLRVDENPAAEGPFTTFVRSSVLTITRVGCMPETTAITRRDTRDEKQIESRSATVERGQSQKMYKRHTAQEAIDEAVSARLDTFPPATGGLTVQAYRYLVSVNTAIFAINLYQAGLDINQTCKHLRDPAFQARLFRTTIDPVQAGDIVCFTENNGLYFSQGIDEVVTYLESLIYAIQVRPNYPLDSQDFCWPQFTVDSPFLGIDTSGIAQYLCPGNSPTAEPSTTASPHSVASVGTSAHGTATQGTASIAPPPTGGPFANSTTIEGTVGPSPNTNPTQVTATQPAVPLSNPTATVTGISTPLANSTASETPGPFANLTSTTLGPWVPLVNATTAVAGSSTLYANSTSTPYVNSTVAASEPIFTTNNIGTVGTAGTATSPNAPSTNAVFPNGTSTGSDTNTVAGAGAGAGTGTGTVSRTGRLPLAATPITPAIESVTSAPTRRLRRW